MFRVVFIFGSRIVVRIVFLYVVSYCFLCAVLLLSVVCFVALSILLPHWFRIVCFRIVVLIVDIVVLRIVFLAVVFVLCFSLLLSVVLSVSPFLCSVLWPLLFVLCFSVLFLMDVCIVFLVVISLMLLFVLCLFACLVVVCCVFICCGSLLSVLFMFRMVVSTVSHCCP